MVVLGHAETHARAEQFFIGHRRSREREARALRRLQKTLRRSFRVLESRIEPASREVRIDLVLRLVRHHVDTRCRPLRLRVGFLDRPLQHADVSTLQAIGCGQDLAAFLRDQLVRDCVDRIGEIDGALRWSVMVMSELIASNLRACMAGIRPSNEFSTQTHLTLSFAHTALPTSMSKPISWPLDDFDSNGAYDASTPKRISLRSAACALKAANAVVAATAKAATF